MFYKVLFYLNLSAVYDIGDYKDYHRLTDKSQQCIMYATFCGEDRVTDACHNENKKLSYRRETARQLPTWREGARRQACRR